MPIETEIVTVDTDPTLLFDSEGAAGGPGEVTDSSVAVLNDSVLNTSLTTVFVGGPGVTSADGFPVQAGGPPFSMSRVSGDQDLYGIVLSGTVDVRVIRQV